jgi:hypothetical protein
MKAYKGAREQMKTVLLKWRRLSGECSTAFILLQCPPHQVVLVMRIQLEVALLFVYRVLGFGVERFEDLTFIMKL